MKFLKENLSWRFALIVLLGSVAVWFFGWAVLISTAPSSLSGGPDEGMRYLIPRFIYENGALPTGYDAATIHSMGNWSYAFYPQFLGPIISAMFMSVVSVFNSSSDALIYAARMTSVLFGVLAIYFVGRSAEVLFKGNKNAKLISFATMLLFAMWPQVAFLSGYVNNDIIALCGVSIIVFACISGYKEKWGAKNTSILAFGFVVCLLSYSNSYGFVLFGGLFFLVSLYWQMSLRRQTFKLIGVVAAITLLFAGPFFIRNAVVYQGDAMGMSSFRERTLEWESETGLEAQKSYGELTGGGLMDLLTDKNYVTTQLESSVARFGKMRIAPLEQYINVYRTFIQIGIAGCLLALVKGGVRYMRQDKSLRVALSKMKYGHMLAVCLLAACMTTVALSIYYTLTIDYQPQGRYIIYLLVPLVLATVYGVCFLLKEIITKKYRLPVAIVGAVIYFLTSISIYYEYVYRVAVG